MEVRDGDRLVRLDWIAVGANAKESLDLRTSRARSRRRSSFRLSAGVDALLTDPASVLPSSAWAVREVRAYVPSHYAVCIDTSPPKDASQLLSLLPTRAADVLRGKSLTPLDGEVVEGARGTPSLGRSVTYCSKLTTGEAREVADAVSGLERDPWPSAWCTTWLKLSTT